ncbi:methyltransferase family protein [Stella humosa]|uniref:Methyltransferase family protein n=1 Tax=Stella humosa TaxID=94 RepID=A0A3N1KKY9_9PROT|nr:methyltransferase domain-containing protein [Stella humosa]ROP81074.1 methyltransferase family protein [Stella humosa]BBK29764.1 methyltransferase [Stella humosa]
MEILHAPAEIAAALDRSPFVPFRHAGICPVCSHRVVFAVKDAWLRESYACERCASIPRERALAVVFRELVDPAAELVIHESSPSHRGFSRWLRWRYPGMIRSHFWPAQPPGATVRGFRNEDLAALTFADASIDVHVTQDVLEHVFDLEQVCREIHRTLKPGGMHLFTTPLVNRDQPTVRRAMMEGGVVRHLVEPPAFHGNPISRDGSLVTYDFGFDIVERIAAAAPLRSRIWTFDDPAHGLRAEYIEVVSSIRVA